MITAPINAGKKHI